VCYLSALLNDEDKGVRGFVREIFESLSDGDIVNLHQFLELYVSSRSLYSGFHNFVDFVSESNQSILDPQWTLVLLKKALDNPYEHESVEFTRESENLVRLAVQVYNHASDNQDRNHAMDIFDRIVQRNPDTALRILKEHDQN
jgi:hypothetical protein